MDASLVVRKKPVWKKTIDKNIRMCDLIVCGFKCVYGVRCLHSHSVETVKKNNALYKTVKCHGMCGRSDLNCSYIHENDRVVKYMNEYSSKIKSHKLTLRPVPAPAPAPADNEDTEFWESLEDTTPQPTPKPKNELIDILSKLSEEEIEKVKDWSINRIKLYIRCRDD